jgi:hypothetical protein
LDNSFVLRVLSDAFPSSAAKRWGVSGSGVQHWLRHQLQWHGPMGLILHASRYVCASPVLLDAGVAPVFIAPLFSNALRKNGFQEAQAPGTAFASCERAATGYAPFSSRA